jgi:hypothetical protein
LKFPNKLILASHITGVYDVNRNDTLPDDDYSIVKNWAESIKNLKLNGIIFHNNFSEETVSKYQNQYISFIKVDYDAAFNPNVYRYFVYKAFLNTNSKYIESVFLTDISDVVTVNNPFIDQYFTDKPGNIFCGDEPKPLENDWMHAHSEHLRSKIINYSDFENKFKNEVLLNCGIVGGNIEVILAFVNKLCNIHQQYNFDNKTAYTGDMGAFNYLIRTEFNECLLHGFPINTIFKEYQTERTDCWFRHK